MRVLFEPKQGTDQPVDGIDVLSHAKIDNVVNYMPMGMHIRVAAKKRQDMVTSPHWWDDKMLVTGKYEKDEFVARVMDHIADQYDGLVGSDPPTWDFPRMGAGSDKNSADAANFRRLSVESMPHDDEDGISTRRSRTRTQKKPIPQCGRLYRYRSNRLKRPNRTRRSRS